MAMDLAGKLEGASVAGSIAARIKNNESNIQTYRSRMMDNPDDQGNFDPGFRTDYEEATMLGNRAIRELMMVAEDQGIADLVRAKLQEVR